MMITKSQRVFLVSILTIFIAATSSVRAEDWTKYHHDLSNSGASGEVLHWTQTSVNALAIKWQFNTGITQGVGVTASPAVTTVNGISTVFVGSSNGSFYAINAVSGRLIWKFQIDAVPNCSQFEHGGDPWCGRIGSSPAVSGGVVYFGASNAYMYALNAANGALVWKRQVGDPTKGAEIWSSPALSNNTVYFGMASHDDVPCVAGKVFALNAATGALIWSFNALDQTSCSGGNCTGAGVWASPAISSNGTVYVGTGNPGISCGPPTPNATRYPDSILALNGSSGQLLNYVQAIANDQQDLDFGSSPVLYNTSTTVSPSSASGCPTPVRDSWLSELNKQGTLYSSQLVPSGALGPLGSIKLSSAEFISTPAFSASPTKSERCGSLPNPGLATYRGVELFALDGAGTTHVVIESDANIFPPSPHQVARAPINSAPAILPFDNIAVFGSDDRNLYITDLAGNVLRTISIGGPIASGPAISNGRIYFGTENGVIYCLSVNGQ